MPGCTTGIQNLIFYAEIFGISEEEGRKRAMVLLEKLGLKEAAEQKLAAYSTGMRQRLSLARAMIHSPKVLFLDEPTSGLDPESAQNVNRIIQELADEQGTTVFLCTHQLRYAQEICTRYGLIEEGSLLAAGTLGELREKVDSGAELLIRVKNLPKRIFQGKYAEEKPDNSGEGLSLKIKSEEDVPGIIRCIVGEGGDVYEVKVNRPSLEDIYFALTARGKEEQL